MTLMKYFTEIQFVLYSGAEDPDFLAHHPFVFMIMNGESAVFMGRVRRF